MATIGKYTTKDGATAWEVRYRTPDQRSTRKRGFATQRDAKAFAATVETSKLKGEFVSASVGRVTVGELGTAWPQRQRGHLKPNTQRTIETRWRRYVEPRWAGVRISTVRYTDVTAWIAEMSATCGPALVKQAHGVLARILDDAVKDRMLPSNPARGVPLPPQNPRRNVYLSAPQLQLLADECGQFGSLILLLGIGGLRWGEAIGLRVCDVDFLRRRIELHRNVVYVAGTFHVGTLKTNENRVVVLPSFVVDALARTAQGKGRDDLLWEAPRAGGYLRQPGGPKSWLWYANQRCLAVDPTFPRVTPHVLRHTAASLAVSAGAHVKVVQRMLGHANASMTLDVYADLFECDLDTVAESVAKMWPQRPGAARS